MDQTKLEMLIERAANMQHDLWAMARRKDCKAEVSNALSKAADRIAEGETEMRAAIARAE